MQHTNVPCVANVSITLNTGLLWALILRIIKGSKLPIEFWNVYFLLHLLISLLVFLTQQQFIVIFPNNDSKSRHKNYRPCVLIGFQTVSGWSSECRELGHKDGRGSPKVFFLDTPVRSVKRRAPERVQTTAKKRGGQGEEVLHALSFQSGWKGILSESGGPPHLCLAHCGVCVHVCRFNRVLWPEARPKISDSTIITVM